MSAGGLLRLGQYETNFRDNKIDADLLPRLDGQWPQGHRPVRPWRPVTAARRNRRIGRRKTLFGCSCFSAEACAFQGSEVSAERRPITVMFCDLVGSTGLAAKLDPEDWRNLVNASRRSLRKSRSCQPRRSLSVSPDVSIGSSLRQTQRFRPRSQ
jgi:hypothetical protein